MDGKKKYLHEYTVDQLINEVGLYQKINIKLEASDEISCVEQLETEDIKILNALIMHTQKIISYCNKCKRENTFQSVIGNKYKDYLFPTNYILNYYKSSINIDLNLVSKKYVENCEYFYTSYTCTYELTHTLVVLYKLSNDGEELALTKIGQWPSIADLQFPEVMKYRKIMGDNYYKEFTKAIGLYSNGIGVGSFVYLRRIYENLIEEIHNEYTKKPEWIDSKFTGKRFTEKIDYLESLGANIFPEVLADIKTQIYGVVSKGIHEYTEDECMTLFEPLKFCIEVILDHKYEKEEKKKKAAIALKTIQKVKSNG